MAAFHIEDITIKNEAFRNVIWTGNNMQLVLMSLQPSEKIDMEVHTENDQFFRIEQGTMKVLISINPNNFHDFHEYHLKNGDVIIIPAGHYHEIYNEGFDDLKVYTIYSPPHHPPDRYDAIKPIYD
jgi:mannose-6-phosphate isomerase-like protein (cupin superfamily)